MTGIQCNECVHYRMLKKCSAFPKGIPQNIFNGTISHKKPFKGDGGIKFESVESKP